MNLLQTKSLRTVTPFKIDVGRYSKNVVLGKNHELSVILPSTRILKPNREFMVILPSKNHELPVIFFNGILKTKPAVKKPRVRGKFLPWVVAW